MLNAKKILVAVMLMIFLSVQLGYAGVANGVSKLLPRPMINMKPPEKAARKTPTSTTAPAVNSTAGNSTPINAFYLYKRATITKTIKPAGDSTAGNSTPRGMSIGFSELMRQTVTRTTAPAGNSAVPKIPKGWGPYSNVFYMKVTTTATKIENIGNSSIGK